MTRESTTSVSTSLEKPEYDDTSSDTSSFYGNAAIKAKYEELDRQEDNFDYVKTWNRNVQVIAARGVEREKKALLARKRKREEESHDHSEADKKKARLEPYNPYENTTTALKLNQPIEEFLKDFIPSSGNIDSPWIWCANFYADRQEQDVASFTQVGGRLLEDFKENLPKLGKSYSKIAAARKKLQEDIVATARKFKVNSGKWMLFPSPGIVDKTWAAVVRGTSDGRLGTAAKVATKPDNPKFPTQVICIYTRNFEDEADIKRVLVGLVRLGLAAPVIGSPEKASENARKQIWYKPDCYTYLDLKSGNEFKIKPSLYGTASLLTANDV